ncbi:hypothetical protein CYY_001871 [Polysphondylium violaceum]|uniref:Protein-serine/threonine phosphatase n=1 Tax=Polysphondylium violaceum TaxID=133409 RepID=A0A8J4V3I4_9MYCE|nr:hypothetical protein CYY_001871 [Polysphondylium violaceum]
MNKLLEDINKKKKNMNHVNDTIVTSVDGKKYKVDLSGHDHDLKNNELIVPSSSNRGDISYGFVVDTKPDDKVYQVIIPNHWLSSGSISGNNSYCKLYIGSQDAAANLNELQLNNIKSILNVGYGIPNHFERTNSHSNSNHNNNDYVISYLNIDMYDDVTYNIRDQFNSCFEFIEKQTSILIHCNAGISRSSTILLAYMMNKFKKPLQECLSLVRESRSCVKPNQGFLKQLEEYEKTLKLR